MEVCTEHWKHFINSQCVGYKYLEHHFLMSPQGIITLGLSSAIDRTPATPANFLFEHFYCSITVVLIFPHYSPLPYPPPPPTFSPPPTPGPGCPCPWVLYTCSLTLPLLSPRIPSPLPSGHCYFVLYFHVSGSILLTFLFCWLDSTYR